MNVRKGDGNMSGGKKKEGRFPCHVWEIGDAEEAKKSIQGSMVRDYGEYTELDDGTVLHYNYMWDDGNRYLLRCEECGGLVIVQNSEFHNFFGDEDDYYSDRIPVASVEEADLLNILWGSLDLEGYPYRSIRGNNFRYFWKDREEQPRPYDTEKLKQQIRENYAGLNPEQKELLENKIREAGKEETESGAD